MAIYNAKFGNQTVDAPEAYDSGAKRLTVSREEAGWDSSTWRYVPHSLKGIKPVTNEPWARDEAVYNTSKNSVDRDGVAGDFTASEMRALSLRAPQDSGPSWDASRKPPEGAMRSYPA